MAGSLALHLHTTKTEAIKRALQQALMHKQEQQARAELGFFLDQFLEKQKRRKLAPSSKEESDAIFDGMPL